ncbi:MAG: sugar transferase [Helicobacteraceae bacterium]|nr:sugar transferase [Helicobacteraceae bacterium]
MYRRFLKPFGDRLFALILLILFSPVMIAIALIVWAKLGSPILFKQIRPGLNAKLFKIYKFRSMSDKRDENGELLSDKERLGRFGRILRSSSLDELPQLFNVFRGDMSFIGPRPLLCEYLPRYNAFQASRHEVKPGITGLAQVNGRNAQSWKKRFEYDVYYAKNVGFWLDLKIAFLTISKALKREGVSEDGNATKSPFMGDENGE